jgi:hypothetical protein
MRGRREYIGEFCLGSSKASFIGLCLGGVGVLYVGIFGGGEGDHWVRGLGMIGIGAVISGVLLYAGYRTVRREEREQALKEAGMRRGEAEGEKVEEDKIEEKKKVIIKKKGK